MAIVVRIDHDGMGAIVDIDRNGDEPVPVESVLHALAEQGVTYGIELSACDQMVATINHQSPGIRISDTGACGLIPIKRLN